MPVLLAFRKGVPSMRNSCTEKGINILASGKQEIISNGIVDGIELTMRFPGTSRPIELEQAKSILASVFFSDVQER